MSQFVSKKDSYPGFCDQSQRTQGSLFLSLFRGTKPSPHLPPTRQGIAKSQTRSYPWLLHPRRRVARIPATNQTLPCPLPLFSHYFYNKSNIEIVLKNLCVCMCVLSHFSHVQLLVILWTIAHQAPLSMGFSRQEYWSGLSCPPPGDIPNPGIKHASLVSCIGRWVLYHQRHLESPILLLINFTKDFSAVVTELIANNTSLQEINPYLQT